MSSHHVRRPHLTISLLAPWLLATAAFAASCPIVKAHQDSPAEQAFQRHEYDKAVTLYNEQLVQKPDDPELVYGLTQVLLRQQKVQQANELVQKASTKEPDSVVLMTALGQVQYRAGTPWLTLATLHKAMQKDPCNPQLRLLDAKMLRLNSFYASAAKEVAVAHKLDPNDPAIRNQWLLTLPSDARTTELQTAKTAETASASPAIPAAAAHADSTAMAPATPGQADAAKKADPLPAKSCHLVSEKAAAEIPFVNIMQDMHRQIGFGLDVKMNDHSARLQLDTGASGLLVSRQVAQRVGLKRLLAIKTGGIGAEGDRSGYLAFADDLRIGELEFQDCIVRVVDSRNAMETDGLIGPDIFSNFLVTLDYPMRKLGLGPLPPDPGDPNPAKPSLDTTSGDGSNPESGDGKSGTVASLSFKAGTQTHPHDRYIAPEMKDWESVMRIGHDLLMPVILNDKVTKMFILDTGAFQTTLEPEVASEISRVSTDNYLRVHGISGDVGKVYTVDEVTFKFGHITQTNRNIVAFASPQISADLGMQVAGFIGVTTLGQLTMKIDYRDGLVKFLYDPNRGYKYPGMN